MIEHTFKEIVETYSSITVYLNTVIETQKVPYSVIYKTSAPRGYTHDGMDGTVISRFQVSVFDKDYKTAKTYASELYPIGNYTDEIIAHTVLSNEIDLYDDASKLHHIVLDFTVQHYE